MRRPISERSSSQVLARWSSPQDQEASPNRVKILEFGSARFACTPGVDQIGTGEAFEKVIAWRPTRRPRIRKGFGHIGSIQMGRPAITKSRPRMRTYGSSPGVRLRRPREHDEEIPNISLFDKGEPRCGSFVGLPRSTGRCLGCWGRRWNASSLSLPPFLRNEVCALAGRPRKALPFRGTGSRCDKRLISCRFRRRRPSSEVSARFVLWTEAYGFASATIPTKLDRSPAALVFAGLMPFLKQQLAA